MVHGIRCTVYGARCTACGAQCTVYGVRCIVIDQRFFGSQGSRVLGFSASLRLGFSGISASRLLGVSGFSVLGFFVGRSASRGSRVLGFEQDASISRAHIGNILGVCFLGFRVNLKVREICKHVATVWEPCPE